MLQTGAQVLRWGGVVGNGKPTPSHRRYVRTTTAVEEEYTVPTTGYDMGMPRYVCLPMRRVRRHHIYKPEGRRVAERQTHRDALKNSP